jgi:hypothetical protein
MSKTSNEVPALVSVAADFVNSVKTMEDLANVVPALPTAQIGAGYAMIKAYEKNFDGLVKAVRDEFIGTQDENGSYNGDGRLFTEGTGQDAKGNPLIELPDGTVLTASKSNKPTFNQDKALNVLSENDVLKEGTDLVVNVKGKTELMDFLTFVQENIPADKQDELNQMVGSTFAYNYVPNEEKIEALITLGKLDPSIVEELFDNKVLYSLLVSKNPYKPKKKKK